MNKTATTVIMDDWPILILQTSDTLEDSMHALDVVEEIYETHQEPYAIVLDARDGRKPTATERNLQNDFRIKHEEHVRKYCRCSALVCNSALIKGIAAAMFLINPEYIGVLFSTSIGNMMLGFGVALATFGFWWMKKCVEIEI